MTEPDLDLSKLSIDGNLRQAMSGVTEAAIQAWRTLGALSSHRPEAGVFLLGLMQVHRDDLIRMSVLVQAVAFFRSPAAARALQEEFLRVPSTPTSRTYLNEVFKALTTLPAEVGLPALTSLAEDKTLSFKWRRRFEEAVDDGRGW